MPQNKRPTPPNHTAPRPNGQPPQSRRNPPTRRYARPIAPILSATQRMRAIRLPKTRTIPVPPSRSTAPHLPVVSKKQRTPFGWSRRRWVITLAIGFLVLVAFVCGVLTIGVAIFYTNGILRGVTVAGVDVGGLSPEEAAQRLQTQWPTLFLRDGERVWSINRQTLGLTVDATATAERAYQQGRDTGNYWEALTGVSIEPIVYVDTNALTAALLQYAAMVNLPPVDAGVAIVNGRAQATAPVNGRSLNVVATVAYAQNHAGSILSAGVLDLVMNPVAPMLTDASLAAQTVTALLANPLTVRVHDPMTGDVAEWSLAPEVWGNWLTATQDANSPGGVLLLAQEEPVRNFLLTQSAVFDATRYLNLDEATTQIVNAITAYNTRPNIRVYHYDRTYVVQAGESITSIAWDYGAPYPWLQWANDGLTSISVGQAITIPSIDNFLDYPIVFDKRIVVSIPQQRVRVYENGALIWDWPASTGIDDSPTWPGIYQILSHEPNAYASIWNLYMPYFMGVYRPIPGSDFTNGFHGFPTRGGGQILWESSLGRRVTFGCILVSTTNARLLYDWAQEGVVVEIQG